MGRMYWLSCGVLGDLVRGRTVSISSMSGILLVLLGRDGNAMSSFFSTASILIAGVYELEAIF
jgi:hypothetical protein